MRRVKVRLPSVLDRLPELRGRATALRHHDQGHQDQEDEKRHDGATVRVRASGAMG